MQARSMLHSQTSTLQWAYRQDYVRAFEAKQLMRWTDGDLMKQAAAAIAAIAASRIQQLPQGSKVLVLAGPGHNGKDALLAMNLLAQSGWDCQAIEGIDESSLDKLHGGLPERGLVIDGWLGLGQRRPLSKELSAAVDRINRWRVARSNRYCLSIDIPTGLNPDAGFVWPTAIVADDCVSLLLPLRGLFTGNARNYWHRIHYAPLIAPLIDAASDSQVHPLIADASFFSKDRLAYRPANAHKGLMGDVVLIGGAKGMDGALILAAQACLAIGVGKCFVLPLNQAASTSAFPAQVMQLEAFQVRQFKATGRGQVLAIGCGLGKSEHARQYLADAIESPLDLVLDADALNLLANDPRLLHSLRESVLVEPSAPDHAKVPRRVVLTPHPLEAARLLGQARDDIERDRFGAIERLVQLTGCTVILKGAGSLVQSPHTQSFIIDRSAPALAQAGSGDMLCGLVAALLARHRLIPSQTLAAAAAFLHADAAARWADIEGRSAGMPFDAFLSIVSNRFAAMA
ncbi:MAG: NAD(P)H-hydrate dehydratase [Betaproteobacteria bacterium]